MYKMKNEHLKTQKGILWLHRQMLEEFKKINEKIDLFILEKYQDEQFMTRYLLKYKQKNQKK